MDDKKQNGAWLGTIERPRCNDEKFKMNYGVCKHCNKCWVYTGYQDEECNFEPEIVVTKDVGGWKNSIMYPSIICKSFESDENENC